MTYTGREATPGTILTIISFGLLLIVNLTTPIIRSLYFVKISHTSDELTIGLWGRCFQNVGGSKSCTSPKIGFAFDSNKALNPNLFPGGLPNGLPNNSTLSYLVVIHIVALITLSIVTCVGASAHTRKNRDRGLIRVAAQSSALAFAFVLFAFIVDFFLFNKGIIEPINNKAGSVYLAEFDVAYYLMISCLVSSGLAMICFFVGKVMNQRRRKSEEESIDDQRNEISFPDEEPNQNQFIPKYAEFEEDVAEADAAKQLFPPVSGSEYFNPFPPNQPQSYPMGPMGPVGPGPYQGHGSRPISPNDHPPLSHQFSYPPPSSHSSAYSSAYNSYSTPSIYPHPYPPNQSPIQPYVTYSNSNNMHQEYPPQSWGQAQPPY